MIKLGATRISRKRIYKHGCEVSSSSSSNTAGTVSRNSSITAAGRLLLLPAAVAAEVIFNAPVLKGFLCGVYIVDHVRDEDHMASSNVPRTVTGTKSSDILKSHKTDKNDEYSMHG